MIAVIIQIIFHLRSLNTLKPSIILQLMLVLEFLRDVLLRRPAF